MNKHTETVHLKNIKTLHKSDHEYSTPYNVVECDLIDCHGNVLMTGEINNILRNVVEKKLQFSK